MGKRWNKIKQKGIESGAIAGLTLTGLFGMNNQEVKGQTPENAIEYLGNPFRQPLNPKDGKNWYGSGDVNRDEGEANIINQNDVSRLEQVINGSFSDPSDTRLMARADVDGDGNVTSSDKTLLQNYVNKTIDYLPAYLNELKTPEEKIDWFRKIGKIAKLSETCDDKAKYPGYVCDCSQFSEQGLIEFNNYDKETLKRFLQTYPGYDTTKHNLFNWPLFEQEEIIYASDGTQAGHAMLGFFSGENALNFSSLENFDGIFDDTDVQIGEHYFGIGDSNLVFIKNAPLKEYDVPGDTPLGYYLRYEIKNKIPSNLNYLYEENPLNKVHVPMITRIEDDNPKVNISSPTQGQITNNPKFVSTVTDETIFDRYKMVNGQKVYYNKNNSYSIDGVKSNDQVFNYTNKSLEGLSDGEHTISVTSIDEFDNETTKAVNFIVDKTPVKFTSPEPVADSTYKDKNVNFIYSAEDANLDLSKSYYKFNGVQTYFSNATDTIPLVSKEGMNKLESYLIDKAGNQTSKIINFEYSPGTPVENISSEDEIIAFPNPSKGTVYFKFKNPMGEDREIELYSPSGQLVGRKKTNGELLEYDISQQPYGFLIYQVLDENKKTIGSGKFVKE